MKTVNGSQSWIYRKYLDLFTQFLEQHARHDIDHDGVLWCSKEEWNAFLFPHIADDDANAIGHLHCRYGARMARTAVDMAYLVQSGKQYICHRLYNMGFVKDLERRKDGRNVSYFRRLGKGEKKTPPTPDSVYILKNILKSYRPAGSGKYRVDVNKACEDFFDALNPAKFPDDDSKVREWNRVIAVLERQGFLNVGSSLAVKNRS